MELTFAHKHQAEYLSEKNSHHHGNGSKAIYMDLLRDTKAPRAGHSTLNVRPHARTDQLSDFGEPHVKYVLLFGAQALMTATNHLSVYSVVSKSNWSGSLANRNISKFKLATAYGRDLTVLKEQIEPKPSATEVAINILDEANKLAQEGHTSRSIGSVYRHFNSLLVKGEFEVVNAVFDRLNYNDLETDVILGLLTITAPARNQLKDRCHAYDEAKRLIDERGEPEDDLLIGL